MKMVAEGNNPHVVNMIGCVTLQEPICLVTEFVKYGDLLTYLTTIRRFVVSIAFLSASKLLYNCYSINCVKAMSFCVGFKLNFVNVLMPFFFVLLDG